MPESKRRKKPQASRPSSPSRSYKRSPSGTPPEGVVAGKQAWWTSERTKRAGWVLVGLAGFTFLQHLISHMGFFVVFSGTADDLLIGYPTAALLGFGGIWLLGRDDRMTRRRRKGS